MLSVLVILRDFAQ